MSGMWSRWAARRRLAGLGFLTGAAVSIGAAVLLFTLSTDQPLLGVGVGAALGFAVVLIVHAGFEFADATKFERLGR